MNTFRHSTYTMLVTMLLLPSVSLATAQKMVARALKARGEVIATQTDGKVRSIKRGAQFYQQDTITVGQNAELVMRYTDGTKMAFLPDTKYKITRFRFDPQHPENNIDHTQLLSGGFKILSGTIGQLNPEKFKIDTPVATVGIRGTEFALSLRNLNLDASTFSGSITIRKLRSTIHTQGQDIPVNRAEFHVTAGQNLSVSRQTVMYTDLPSPEIQQVATVELGGQEIVAESSDEPGSDDGHTESADEAGNEGGDDSGSESADDVSTESSEEASSASESDSQESSSSEDSTTSESQDQSTSEETSSTDSSGEQSSDTGESTSSSEQSTETGESSSSSEQSSDTGESSNTGEQPTDTKEPTATSEASDSNTAASETDSGSTSTTNDDVTVSDAGSLDSKDSNTSVSTDTDSGTTSSSSDSNTTSSSEPSHVSTEQNAATASTETVSSTSTSSSEVASTSTTSSDTSMFGSSESNAQVHRNRIRGLGAVAGC